jgi:hypothetical protein
MTSSETDAAAEVLARMLAAGDEPGLSFLELLVAGHDQLSELLHRTRAGLDFVDIQRFVDMLADEFSG